MSSLECRGVVSPVSRHRHHLIEPLERLHEPLLVHRSGSGDHPQPRHPFVDFLIGEGGEVFPRDDALLPVVLAPEADLSPDLAGGGGGVAGDNLHVDAGTEALLYGVLDILPHRVTDCDNALEGEPLEGHALAL